MSSYALLYCNVLFCSVLYCAVFYWTILHCIREVIWEVFKQIIQKFSLCLNPQYPSPYTLSAGFFYYEILPWGCRQSEMSNITWRKSLLGWINKNCQQIISINWTSEMLNLNQKSQKEFGLAGLPPVWTKYELWRICFVTSQRLNFGFLQNTSL